MRIRIRFTKQGKVRFISHRDLARVWERSLRKADLPMTYTEGFSPRPKMHFGLALSTGYESLCEYMDIDLDADEIDLVSLPARLTAVLPNGVEVETVAETPSIGATSLQEAVTSCSWRIELSDTTLDIAQRAIEHALASPTVMATRIRKGQGGHR